MEARLDHGQVTARPAAGARALIWFTALMALVLVVFSSSWWSMTSLWWANPTYTHGFIIVPLVLGLLWLSRRSLATLTPTQEPLALIGVAGFAFLWLLGRAAEVSLVQNVAVVGLPIGLFILVFGRSISRRLAFHLGFLFFMVPIGDFAIPHLQGFTAEFSVRALRLIGIPVFHDGIWIYIPSGVFEVAEACAGLRFLIGNIVIATLWAYLVLTKWWKIALFLSLSVIVPIIANGFRALGIILIAYFSDHQLAVGVDHIVYGWGFFSLIMILLLFIGHKMADRSAEEAFQLGVAPGLPPNPRHPARPWRSRWCVLAALVLMAGPAYAQVAMRPPADAGPVTVPPPPVGAGWTAAVPAGPDWQPVFPGADGRVLAGFRRGDRAANLFIAYYRYQRRTAKVTYFANRFDHEPAWTRLETGQIGLGVSGFPERVPFDRLAAGQHRRLVVYWYWVGGTFTGDPVVAVLLQLANRMIGRDGPAAVLAVAADFEESPEQALAVIEDFLAEAPPLDAYLEAVDSGRR